jgi:hypothetical protein
MWGFYGGVSKRPAAKSEIICGTRVGGLDGEQALFARGGSHRPASP